jgi:hypothetical protein
VATDNPGRAKEPVVEGLRFLHAVRTYRAITNIAIFYCKTSFALDWNGQFHPFAGCSLALISVPRVPAGNTKNLRAHAKTI